MSTQANQGGSQFTGPTTVSGGSLQQGNIINIQKTANQCLADLRVTDPRHDKKRIQGTKGGLLPESYVWVFDNPEFREWRDNEDQRLLWVKGDPGKGKTMLLCGIIDKLEKSSAEGKVLAYFLCQASDERLNTATAVLRGLIFMLLDQDASLVLHMKKKYDAADKKLFEEPNAWQALSEIFMDMLRDPKLQGVCLVVDALDECVGGLPQLLELITETSRSTRTKWLVSSRNWPQIEEQLSNVAHRLSLEVNAKSVADAVDSYITHKVAHLTQRKRYRDNTAEGVRQYLLSNADGTFLWVSLVCQELEKTRQGKALQMVKSFPPGLDALYRRMMQQIQASDDAELCTQVLALVATTYRPPSLTESTTFIEESGSTVEDAESLEEIVGLCGSFLTVREKTIYFVHQSAKDFLMKTQLAVLFPQQQATLHGRIFFKSIEAMSQTLKRDIYRLHDPGFPIEDVSLRVLNPDPLAAIGYSCIYWANHFIDATKAPGRDDSVQKYEAVNMFLRSKSLYWIEALSLLRGVSEGILTLERLTQHLKDYTGVPQLEALALDVCRLLQSFGPGIESRPLQTYASALVFSPRQSIVRDLFGHEAPGWVQCRTAAAEQWSACITTLEGHTAYVTSAAFSPDGRHVVSSSWDHTVKVWNAVTGACVATLKGHESFVYSVAFSPDGQRIISTSADRTAKIWDSVMGACVVTLEGHTSSVISASFSPDGRRVVSASNDSTAKVWDTTTGVCGATLKGHIHYVCSAAFSPDGLCVLSASRDGTAKLWDAVTGTCVVTLEGHRAYVYSAAFSVDGRCVVSESEDGTAKLWDTATGACLMTLECHSAAFLPDGRRVISVSRDRTIKLWDAATGACEETIKCNTAVGSVSFSADGRRIVTISGNQTVKVLDAVTGTCEAILRGHTNHVNSAVFSPDGRRIISASKDRTAKIWDAVTGTCMTPLEGHTSPVVSVDFLTDGQHILTSDEKSTKIWNAATGACKTTLAGRTTRTEFSSGSTSAGGQRVLTTPCGRTAKSWNVATLENNRYYDYVAACSADGRRLILLSDVNTFTVWDWVLGAHQATLDNCIYTSRKPFALYTLSVAFSPNGQYVLGVTYEGIIRVWDAATGACVVNFFDYSECEIYSAVFSPDGRCVLSASRVGTAKLCDTATGACVVTLEGHRADVYSAAFSPDGKRVVSASRDKTVRLWDVQTGTCESILAGHTSSVTSATFSVDGRRVVSASDDGTVKVWDAAKGACLSTYGVESTTSVSFDPTGTLVHTDAGYITIDSIPAGLDTRHVCLTRQQSYSLSPDRRWVQRQSKPVLWLPLEYRPRCFAVATVDGGTNLVLGYASGHVCVLYLAHFNA